MAPASTWCPRAEPRHRGRRPGAVRRRDGCGDDESDNANPKPAAAAAYGGALLAQIPTLGETYAAQLTRFVDTEEGKPFGLAVTVADDGTAVAYLCDGKTLGRAFVGTIEDAAGSATLKAVKRAPSATSATV